MRVHIVGAPRGWALTDPPEGMAYVRAPAPADVVLAFFTVAADLPRRLPGLAERVRPAGAVWIAWPRRASGHHSDITDDVIRDHALPLGIVDVKVAAIDEDWSGLKLVWRRENR